jgi:hypothetical protein
MHKPSGLSTTLSILSTREDEDCFVAVQSTSYFQWPKVSLIWNLLAYYIDSCLREAWPCSLLLALDFPIFGANYFQPLCLGNLGTLSGTFCFVSSGIDGQVRTDIYYCRFYLMALFCQCHFRLSPPQLAPRKLSRPLLEPQSSRPSAIRSKSILL